MATPVPASPPSVPSPFTAADHQERLLLTLTQAAHALSISKRTLERLIAGEKFPRPLKLGRSSRISREDISNYLEQLRRERGDKLGTS